MSSGSIEGRPTALAPAPSSLLPPLAFNSIESRYGSSFKPRVFHHNRSDTVGEVGLGGEAAKREVRVAARGTARNQAASRSRLTAAAVAHVSANGFWPARGSGCGAARRRVPPARSCPRSRHAARSGAGPPSSRKPTPSGLERLVLGPQGQSSGAGPGAWIPLAKSAQAARAAKREVRVAARGTARNQAASRSRLTAAAVATCCRCVLASPR